MTLYLPCNKRFGSAKALQQHQETSSKHAYCERCNKHLANPNALQQHWQDSPRHHICRDCDPPYDLPNMKELDKHIEQRHQKCVACNIKYDDQRDFQRHDIDQHNLCIDCEQYFETPSNLRNHRQTHLAKNLKCFGCKRMISKYSHMVLHVENAGCALEVDCEDVIDLASECKHSFAYESSTNDYNFECPTCATPFQTVSGLLQHVESDACEEDMTSGSALSKLILFLRSRL
ncbi:hypothetical protein VHEMI01670 [[Torrubiella] hemipterigena]|uniref:C2H2-type domain-containing protein n=1 Tax=[Torrubiella] hemipterigena TaxID=1531966 RepID=A0A0A1T872_9HYPO|nr:hypothetical protein VHEMI01670 [[Torrubiella] hemipterigena]